MADFTHYSNYSEETSFSSVIFGANAPVLETELNEVQQIEETKIKRIIEAIGEGAFALPTGNIVYNNGVVTIRNYIILSRAFTAFVDLASVSVDSTNKYVYIALEESEVTGNSTLKAYGNTSGTVISNPIIDSRMQGAETTRRKVINVTLSASIAIPMDTDTVRYIKVCEFTGSGIKVETAGNLTERLRAAEEHLGDVTQLTTENKDSLVNAINELKLRADSYDVTFDVTILESQWVGNSAPYVATLTIPGIQATADYEIIGFTPTGNTSEDTAIKISMGRITYGSSAVNTLTFTATSEKPEVDLPLRIKKSKSGSMDVIDLTARSAIQTLANSKPDIDDTSTSSTTDTWSASKINSEIDNAKHLANLSDVDIDNPTSNQALVWDSVNNKWVNGEVSTVGGLNDLNDVTIDDTNLEQGQELVYNGTEEVFENKTTRVELTQAEYDALANPLPDVDYYITDAPSMQGTSADLSYDGDTDSVYDVVEEVKGDVADLDTNKANKATSLAGYGITDAYTKNSIDSNNVRKYSTGWGTTCETTLGRYQFIVIRGATMYVVWLASTNDVNVTNVGTNAYVTGTGSATIDGTTFTRLSNNNLKVTLSSSGTITIFG